MAPYSQSRWSLQDLLLGLYEPVLLSYLDARVSAVETARSGPSPNLSNEEFLKLLDSFERQTTIANGLGPYINSWFYEDAQNLAAWQRDYYAQGMMIQQLEEM